MSQELAALLGETAEGARDYADAAAALARARRRRRFGALAAGTLVLALLAGGALLTRGGSADPMPTDRGAGRDPVYPAEVTPAADAEPLPTDRAVGTASFIYSAYVGGVSSTYLVLPDGHQFRLGDHPSKPVQLTGYSLSPDGRYLGWDSPMEYRIRDLLGTAVVSVRVSDAWAQIGVAAWSPSGRYALVEWRGEGPPGYVRVTTDGSSPQVRVPVPDPFLGGRDDVKGILDSGEVVLVTTDRVHLFTRIRVVRADTLAEVRSVAVDVEAVTALATANGGETGSGLLLGQWGGGVVDIVFTSPEAQIQRPGMPTMDSQKWQVGLVRLDLATGRPVSWFGSYPPVRDDRYQPVWRIAAETPTGYVALSRRADRLEIVLIDRTTGTRTAVTRLPDTAAAVTRGARWPHA